MADLGTWITSKPKEPPSYATRLFSVRSTLNTLGQQGYLDLVDFNLLGIGTLERVRFALGPKVLGLLRSPHHSLPLVLARGAVVARPPACLDNVAQRVGAAVGDASLLNRVFTTVDTPVIAFSRSRPFGPRLSGLRPRRLRAYAQITSATRKIRPVTLRQSGCQSNSGHGDP